jgi:hypothetical protein
VLKGRFASARCYASRMFCLQGVLFLQCFVTGSAKRALQVSLIGFPKILVPGSLLPGILVPGVLGPNSRDTLPLAREFCVPWSLEFSRPPGACRSLMY